MVNEPSQVLNRAVAFQYRWKCRLRLNQLGILNEKRCLIGGDKILLPKCGVKTMPTINFFRKDEKFAIIVGSDVDEIKKNNFVYEMFTFPNIGNISL
ncbi:unnamed protein product [Hymenolepis diminuta]|uniref:Thioredoxin domain-containing protein n=1 Tax=Hymenolepis diminuta TaxID=6216 RepID=A0A564Y237_HYMDI|nr:unnamed protein product [Hymenolepis diminuta]